MKVVCFVKPRAKQTKIEKTGENQFSIWVNEPPIDNKANKAVIEILSEYFNVSKSDILLLRGERSKIKVFNINRGLAITKR